MNSIFRNVVTPLLFTGVSLALPPSIPAHAQSVRSKVREVFVGTEFQPPADEQLYTIQRKKAGSGYSDVYNTDLTGPQIDFVQPNSAPRLMPNLEDDADSGVTHTQYQHLTPNESSNAPWYFPESHFEERPAKDGWVKSGMRDSLNYNNERTRTSESFAKEGKRLNEAAHHSEKMAAIYITISAAMLLQIAALLLSERYFKKRLQKAIHSTESEKAEHLRYTHELRLEIENLRSERQELRKKLQEKSTLCSSYSVHNKRLGEIQDRLRTKIEKLEERIIVLQRRLESSPSMN